jgi:predicted transcriptional regulator
MMDRSQRIPLNQRNVGNFVGLRRDLNTLLVSTLKTTAESVGVISVWGLKADYPMVAPNYAKKRQELAKKIGLGRKPRVVEPEPTPAPKARRSRAKAAA